MPCFQNLSDLRRSSRSASAGIPRHHRHKVITKIEGQIPMSQKFRAPEIGCVRVPKPKDATQQIFTGSDHSISRSVTYMNPTALLVRGNSAGVDRLNRDGARSDSIDLGFGATSANKATKAFVCDNAVFGHLGVSGSPQLPENYGFTGINASGLSDTNRNAVGPVELDLETGSPSRGVIATATPYEADALDLSGLVSKLGRRPVFKSSYSEIYVGRYGHHKVAIKVLRMVESDRVTDRKFLRERFIWWHLCHPNIPPLQRYFEDGVEVSHALVFEWGEGGSAAEYVHQDLSWDQQMNLLCAIISFCGLYFMVLSVQLHDVTKGPQYLHGMDHYVVHRDLDPLNVRISKDGAGRLCDFGLAHLIQAKSYSGMTTTTAHPRTVRYLARELVECSRKDIPPKATDMYALGCLVLEFIYKILHYSGLHNPWEILRAIWEWKPPAERPMHLEKMPASPEDTDLGVLESEPYLAERFGVHVPNLFGQVRRLNKGTIFPGRYSTVYPGMYGDKKVAIKLLRMVKRSDNIQRKFRRELFIWSRLQHVNVLPLYGYFEDKEDGDGFPSLISKWAEHGSAAQYTNRDLRWDQRTSLLYDVAKGLNYLHGFEPLIVHADLKPQNVVVDNDGVGQLCDFGLTRFMQDGLETGLLLFAKEVAPSPLSTTKQKVRPNISTISPPFLTKQTVF